MNVFEELLQEIIRNGDSNRDDVVDTSEQCNGGNHGDTDGNAAPNAADTALKEWYLKLNPLLAEFYK